jgi:hypothetical protein
MRPGAQHGGGHDRAHPGSPGPHQPQDGLAVVGGLGGQLPDPTGQAPQGRGRGGGLHVPASLDAQPGAGRHQLSGRADPEPFPHDLRCRNDQGVELALSVAGGWTAERRAASRTDSAARAPAARGWAS